MIDSAFLDLWSIAQWFVIFWAVVMFLFARDTFFVSLAGFLTFGLVGGIVAAYALEAPFGAGFVISGLVGAWLGMLASQHSGFTIGKLGTKSPSLSMSGLFTVISFPGYLLNLVQYFFQCPWRGWLKNYDSFFSRFARSGFGGFILGVFSIAFYLLSFPLRFVCAVYYNLFVRLLSALTDIFLEVVIPKVEGMRHKSFFAYVLLWIVKLPWRILKFLFAKTILALTESVFFTVYDTFVPTLTMFHGTSEEASALITTDGEWKVGAGNYAGSGIYFAIFKRTADHYQRLNPHGVIIVSRVSLGRILTMSRAPRTVRQMVAGNGDGITTYGLEHGYRSTEWWRRDSDWWEYCLLDKGGSYDHPWHIRELYIYYAETGVKKRIYGSMASWFFK